MGEAEAVLPKSGGSREAASWPGPPTPAPNSSIGPYLTLLHTNPGVEGQGSALRQVRPLHAPTPPGGGLSGFTKQWLDRT